MSMDVDLSVRIGSLELANPVMTASGTFASGREFAQFIDLSRLGAIVTKGVSSEPWPGNASPRVAETASGMLNSIGLQNPGVESFIDNDLTWLSAQAPRTPVIVNVSGHSVDDYVRVIERLEDQQVVSAYEVNISCPNVDEGGMAFGTDCASAARVTAACRAATSRTLIVKLSPNVTDIVSIARSVEAEGADGVSLINTLLGMAIDASTRGPNWLAWWADFPDRRSSPSPCGWYGRSRPPSASRSSGWAACATARMPSSSCSPARVPWRSAPPTSSTPRRRFAFSTVWESTVASTA